jgi:hypothetical protein
MKEGSQTEEITWAIAKDSEEVVSESKNKNYDNEEAFGLLPWEKYKNDDFAIAITGKAFNYLIKN